jgi:hypothetical protein
MMRRLLIAGLLSLLPVSAYAQTMVEIPPGQAWQPIINKAPAGSTFVIKAGVHRMQQITARTGDTFLGETQGGILLAIVSGAKVLDGWQRDGSAWFVTGQTQQGQRLGGVCWSTHPRCDYPEDLFFDNVMKTHVASRGQVGAGTWFFDYAADRIYVGDDPSGRVVETSVTPNLFHLSAASRVTVDRLIVEKYAAASGTSALSIGASASGGVDWSVRNSIVRWNHGGGIGTDSRTSAINNLVHHNCGFGFTGAGSDILIEGNEIAYNNIAAGATVTRWSANGSDGTCGYNSYWGAGGSKWVWTTNLIVRNNRSHHNDGPGLWTDINNIGTLYEQNVAFENARSGIFHEISYDAVIRKNTLKRNGLSRDYPWWTTSAGIEVTSSRNVEVYENTLEDNFQGITGLNDHRGAGEYGPWTLINLLVHGNVITYTTEPDAGTGRTGVIDSANLDAFRPQANNRYTNNSYTRGGEFLWLNQTMSKATWHGQGMDVENATGGTAPPGIVARVTDLIAVTVYGSYAAVALSLLAGIFWLTRDAHDRK